MYETPSPNSALEQGTEWEYLAELEAMANWLCEGDEASPALQNATRSIHTFRGPKTVKRWLHSFTSFELDQNGDGTIYGEHLERMVNGGKRSSAVDPVGLKYEVSRRLAVMERLCDLPDNYRCAVLLKDGYGLSVEKSAALMGVSTGSMRSILYRARQSMR